MKGPIDLEPLFPDRTSREPLAAQLVRRLRRAVETGFFPAGVKLLPSRDLAKRLGLARNTVTFALDQLIAEGYLEARVGAGTFVAQTIHRDGSPAAAIARELPAAARALLAVKNELDEAGNSAGPLRTGAPDFSAFPLHAWRRIARRHLARAGQYLDYANSGGALALREAIARHIAQFRGVVADPDRITIVEGTQGALQLIALALTRPGDAIVVEDPCYAHARASFRAHGLTLEPVPVDDSGMQTAALPHAAALAYVSPSHQFPLGGAMPHARRLELLQWAGASGAYVVEDDYDSEFDAHPLPALQSLDRDGSVIYVGTFSKTLAPGLRAGYVVAPAHLAPAFAAARAAASFGVPEFLQATLADFIAEGHFSRHVRRMTAVYERRRRILVDTLRKHLPDGFRTGPAQTGLHVAVVGPRQIDDVAMTGSLGEGARCLPLSSLCVARTDCKGAIAGFSAGDDASIARAATILAGACRRALERRH